MKRLLCGVVVLFLCVAGRANADYVFTRIDVPGSTFTTVAGINNLGQIVGNSPAGSFLLSGGTYAMLNLRAPPNGINDLGQIVGGDFIYSGGNYTTLNVPVAVIPGSTVASGINNAGQVVGFYQDRTFGAINSFVYSGGTYTTNLIHNLHYDPAFGINNVGQVVGQALNEGYRFDLGGGSTLFFYAPDAEETTPHGIDDSGQIVGVWNRPDGIHHAFLLSDSVFTTFDVPGASMTEAYGISNAGDIVGTYVDANGVQHGFLAAPVPEPSTLLLLGIGTLGLICSPRRYRSRVLCGLVALSLLLAVTGQVYGRFFLCPAGGFRP
jgi:probable HAF family extracellular repeat protein